MITLFHDPQSHASNDDALRKNYLEYARRVAKLIAEIKEELNPPPKSSPPAVP